MLFLADDVLIIESLTWPNERSVRRERKKKGSLSFLFSSVLNRKRIEMWSSRVKLAVYALPFIQGERRFVGPFYGKIVYRISSLAASHSYQVPREALLEV